MIVPGTPDSFERLQTHVVDVLSRFVLQHVTAAGKALNDAQSPAWEDTFWTLDGVKHIYPFDWVEAYVTKLGGTR